MNEWVSSPLGMYQVLRETWDDGFRHRRSRKPSTSKSINGLGSWRRSYTSTLLLFPGSPIIGMTKVVQPVSDGYMREVCKTGSYPTKPNCSAAFRLLRKLEEPIIKTWLPITNQAYQTNSGPHVRQRVMDGLMTYTVGRGQIFKPKTGPTIIVPGPLYSFWS